MTLPYLWGVLYQTELCVSLGLFGALPFLKYTAGTCKNQRYATMSTATYCYCFCHDINAALSWVERPPPSCSKAYRETYLAATLGIEPRNSRLTGERFYQQNLHGYGATLGLRYRPSSLPKTCSTTELKWLGLVAPSGCAPE